MAEKTSLLSAAELEALIQSWGARPGRSVDKFLPLVFWYLLVLVAGHAALLLFDPDALARRLTSQPDEFVRISSFLYFRGWWLCGILFLGAVSYLRSWYPAIVFGSLFVAGCMNLLMDVFAIYWEALANPTKTMTVLILLRLIGLWCVFQTVRNARHLPEPRDRANILLPFRKDP